jgi:CRISPR-associated protein Csx17
MNVLKLDGCKPAPLAHYLKALGILRVVAEQIDPSVRGAWRGGRFVLLTKLTREALLDFILCEYAPSPILSPWNGGSGFYPKDNQAAIDALATSRSPRFARYREAIRRTREIVGEREARPDAGASKNALLAECLAEWDEAALSWFSSSVMLDDQGEPSYPSLLGTGGNDGRLDFTNNYMQRLVQLFDPTTGAASDVATLLLPNALFDEPSPNLSGGSIGQFNPGSAGGANSGAGFEGSPKWNPWDFVLMLEGALVLRVAGLRKLESGYSVQASAPFALRATARGFGTATDGEKGRGEQWLPLWSAPASYSEVSHLFAEARLRTAGGKTAQGALDAAKALGALGVARGVDAFVRYGYLARNGDSHYATSTGVFAVKHRPEVRYLDEIDDFLRRVRGAGTRSTAFQDLSRVLENATLACAESPADSRRWQILMMALGDAEHAMNARPKLVVETFMRPIPKLSLEWFAALDDGSPEVRLALSVATAGDAGLGPVRRHAIPLDPQKSYRELAKTSEALAHDPAVVWGHRDLASDLAAVAARRAVESASDLFPLSGPYPASLGDVALFLDGSLDEARILRLARGMMALDISRHADVELRSRGRGSDTPLAAHAMVRLAYPTAVGDFPQKHASGHALRLLASGQLPLASRALRGALAARGIRMKLRTLSGSAAFARRLAASVAIPVSARDHCRLFQLIGRPDAFTQEETQPS